MKYKWIVIGLLVAVFVFYFRIGETENVDNEEVEELKKEVETLKTQVRELYFMTERLRIPIVDKLEGSFYYARDRDGYWSMLPTEVPRAELYYLIRSAPKLGYSVEKQQALVDKFKNMKGNPYLKLYETEYTAIEVRKHPDMNAYIEVE